MDDKNESKISDHKQYKNELTPPLLQIGNMNLSSWIDERLPEMLWAVLVVGNVDRENALKFFRHIAAYVDKDHDCYDITMTGISKFPDSKRKEFIARAISWSDEIKTVLRPLSLFPGIPAGSDWREFLGQPNVEEDWQKLAAGVSKTFWHQSEEATDCRWIKLLCWILAGRITSSYSMEDTVRGIIEYPNYGDLRHISSSIRAQEIALRGTNKETSSEWALNFWQYCFDKTGCIPEEEVNEKIKDRQTKLSKEIEEAREHYLKSTMEIRNKLIDHFFATAKISAIDSRHEGAFGLTLYGLTLFIEIIFYNAPLSITGRVALRSLVETYITFKYLLKKEKAEPRIWDDYRSYGAGQIKLIYLKLKELGQETSSIEIENLGHLANEDKWVEFVPINLGHWDSANLRKISDEVGLKDLYDKYYNYTSGYIHANWGAVREAVYQKCVNPLHRFHRVPTYDLPLMPSVTADARSVTNNIFECLSEAYPKFDFRLTDMQSESNPPSS